MNADDIVKLIKAYGNENLTLAGDTILHDPILSSRPGDKLTMADAVTSKKLSIDGCIHSAKYHAAQDILSPIAASTTTNEVKR